MVVRKRLSLEWTPFRVATTVLVFSAGTLIAGGLGLLDYDPDSMVQFERVGFARIDRHEDAETVAYYAHS